MRRKAMWVTVDATEAQVSTKVRSVHRSRTAAQGEAYRARWHRGESRQAVSAQVIALMQEGSSYTDAVQALAGKPYEPAYVEV